MQLTKTFNIGYSITVFFLSIAFLIILGYQYFAETVTNENFFLAYIVLGVISALCAAINVFFNIIDTARSSKTEEGVASAFYLSETSRLRVFSHPAAKIGVAIILSAFVLAITFGVGSLFPVGNPYSAEPLSQASLQEHGIFQNLWNIAVYPGWYEEMPLFFLVNIIVFAFTWAPALLFKRLDLRKNPFLFLIGAFTGVTAAATIFMLAHNQAYGLDAQAKVSAFLFEWIVQAANQATGSFISWLPHLLHNALITLRTQLSFAIGGVAATVLLIPGGISAGTSAARDDTLLLLKQGYQDLRRCVA